MTSYKDSTAVNNSSLSYLDLTKGGSPQKFKDFMDGKIETQDTKYYREGSLIHLALLEPEKLIKADITRPVESVVQVVDAVFDFIQADTDEFTEMGNLSDYPSQIVSVMDEKAYQTNWKAETRLNKIIELGSEYFEFLKRSSKEIVLSSEEHAKILSCASSVRTDRFAKTLMLDSELNPDSEGMNEIEIYFNIENSKNSTEHIPCKAKVDRIILNHKTKTFALIDLKTTGKSVLDFPKAFFDYDYDRQIAFYAKAVQEQFPGYKPSGYYFVVVEKFGEFRTRVFKIGKSAVKAGWNKVAQLLSMYLSCKRSGDFTYEPGYTDIYVIDDSMNRETVFQGAGIDSYRQYYKSKNPLKEEESKQEIRRAG